MNRFIVYLICVTTAMSLLFACQNTENKTPMDNQPLTEADRLVQSEEFRQYEEAASRHTALLSSRIEEIRRESPRQLNDICMQILHHGPEEIASVYEQFSDLLGDDIKESSRKLDLIAKKVFSSERSISLDELINAIQKRESNNRLQTKSTVTANRLESCLDGCQTSYDYAAIICKCNHNHTSAKEIELCELERYAIFVLCQNKCRQDNPPTPPVSSDSVNHSTPIPSIPTDTTNQKPTGPSFPGNGTNPTHP